MDVVGRVQQNEYRDISGCKCLDRICQPKPGMDAQELPLIFNTFNWYMDGPVYSRTFSMVLLLYFKKNN